MSGEARQRRAVDGVHVDFYRLHTTFGAEYRCVAGEVQYATDERYAENLSGHLWFAAGRKAGIRESHDTDSSDFVPSVVDRPSRLERRASLIDAVDKGRLDSQIAEPPHAVEEAV